MTVFVVTDISHFEKVADYLPILNAALYADIGFIILLYNKAYHIPILEKWYKQYQLSAVLADVLSIVIGIILARFFYSSLFSTFSIWKFILLAVLIQVFHDFTFYGIFQSAPTGHNAMLDFFKEYARNLGVTAVLGDSAMMIITALIASLFTANLSMNENLCLFIFGVYLIPYLINYK